MKSDESRPPETKSMGGLSAPARDCADCETKEGMLDEIERVIEIEGPLDAEQKRRILEIADKCPVHRTPTSEVKIRSRLA